MVRTIQPSSVQSQASLPKYNTHDVTHNHGHRVIRPTIDSITPVDGARGKKYASSTSQQVLGLPSVERDAVSKHIQHQLEIIRRHLQRNETAGVSRLWITTGNWYWSRAVSLYSTMYLYTTDQFVFFSIQYRRMNWWATHEKKCGRRSIARCRQNTSHRAKQVVLLLLRVYCSKRKLQQYSTVSIS